MEENLESLCTALSRLDSEMRAVFQVVGACSLRALSTECVVQNVGRPK